MLACPSISCTSCSGHPASCRRKHASGMPAVSNPVGHASLRVNPGGYFFIEAIVAIIIDDMFFVMDWKEDAVCSRLLHAC